MELLTLEAKKRDDSLKLTTNLNPLPALDDFNGWADYWFYVVSINVITAYTRIWDFAANTRGVMFRLQQSLHELDIIDYSRISEDSWRGDLDQQGQEVA
jgi:hypothetical protein